MIEESFNLEELDYIYLLLERSKDECRDELMHPSPDTDPDEVKRTQAIARSASRKIVRMLRSAGFDPVQNAPWSK